MIDNDTSKVKNPYTNSSGNLPLCCACRSIVGSNPNCYFCLDKEYCEIRWHLADVVERVSVAAFP